MQTRFSNVAAGSLLVILTGVMGFAPQNRSPVRADERERIRHVLSSVGVILVRNPRSDSGQDFWARGSGVLVRRDGVVATSLHVIEQDNSDTFYDELFFGLPRDGGEGSSGMNRYRLSVALTSGKYDLALLRIVPGEGQSPIRKDFPTVEMATTATVQVMDDLAIIGYPETGGATVTVNMGIVEGIVEGTDPGGGWIKTDGRLLHGNSGGAVVNVDGKLIGIPTRLVLDEDKGRAYGAVGFVRPVSLVVAMLAELNKSDHRISGEKPRPTTAVPEMGRSKARVSPSATGLTQEPATGVTLVTVRGIVRSSTDGKPLAGVRVGLIPAGNQDVTETTLLAWGGSNGDGEFEMNRKVTIGRYTLKAKAIGYDVLTREVEISRESMPLVITLEPSS
jgi:S1-C subfamily serine protease